jgi:hypothetical protein
MRPLIPDTSTAWSAGAMTAEATTPLAPGADVDTLAATDVAAGAAVADEVPPEVVVSWPNTTVGKGAPLPPLPAAQPASSSTAVAAAMPARIRIFMVKPPLPGAGGH